MAENTIDNLSIQVTANADKAASVFDRLASSAGRLRGAASGAAGGMQDVAQGAREAGTATATAGEQAGRAQTRIRGVGNAAKDAGDKAKKGSNGLKTFWESLKRIAYYRMIRHILKSIAEAFSEGISNLYQWSAAVNEKNKKKKFKGVTIGEKVVVIAVREIDNATFPFDNDDKKFEILPPGHDAINIIPNAIIGVISGLSNNAIRNVTAGRANHCKNTPRAIDLGFLTTSIIVRGLILNATPNMTKARIIFTIIIPSSPKFIVKEFKDSNCSFISLPMFICANI